MRRSLLTSLLFWAIAGSMARADIVYTVTINTSSLAGHGPFTLDLQFVDGSGTPTDLNNNTIQLHAFQFGGGAALGGGTAIGGATGSLSSGVTMTDSVFFNEYLEDFTPGGALSFQVKTTNVADPGGTPDLFTLAILDHLGSELPTTGPAGEFLSITLAGGTSPAVESYASPPGSAFSIGAPLVEPQNPVPEPAGLFPLALVLASLALRFGMAGRLKGRR